MDVDLAALDSDDLDSDTASSDVVDELPPDILAEDLVTELGTYLDGENILLRYDPSAEAWFRLMSRTTRRVPSPVSGHRRPQTAGSRSAFLRR